MNPDPSVIALDPSRGFSAVLERRALLGNEVFYRLRLRDNEAGKDVVFDSEPGGDERLGVLHVLDKAAAHVWALEEVH